MFAKPWKAIPFTEKEAVAANMRRQPANKKPTETEFPTVSTKNTLTLPNDLLSVLNDAAVQDLGRQRWRR